MSRSWRTVDLDFKMVVALGKRKSRRNLGEEPLPLEDVAGSKYGREMKNLVTKGGRAGRLHKEISPQWEYFPMKRSLFLSATERKEHNKNVFSDITEHDYKIEDEDNDNAKQHNDYTNQENTSSYQMVDLKNLEEAINRACVSRYSSEDVIDDFLEHCVQVDNQMTVLDMMALKEKWQKDRKSKQEIEIQCVNIGLEAKLSIRCLDSNKVTKVKQNTSSFHGYSYQGKPCKNENSSWYDTNLRLVLGTLASGLGPSDICTLLAFMGLPNVNSFSRKQFRQIESLIGKHLRQIGDDSMTEALEKEVRMTQAYKDMPTIHWKSSQDKIGLTVAYDMGWTKRSSGNRYDSLSGHAFMVGVHSQKIIRAQVTGKMCSVCSTAETKGEESGEHECPKNYVGSSKGMEADGALSLVLKLDDITKSKIFIESFVSDDDSSLRAIMRHHHPKGKGMLPPHIPEPKWLADPTHRTKIVANAIFSLVNNKPKVDSVCSNADALRIKKYFGYMFNEGRWLTLEQFCQKSKAVVEHLFNCHEFCDPRWCLPSRIQNQTAQTDEMELPDGTRAHYSPPLVQTARSEDHPPFPSPPDPADNRREHNNEPTPTSFYRCKIAHRELYLQMIAALAPYTTPERLLELMHPWSTQLNEALNHIVAKYAPKDRT